MQAINVDDTRQKNAASIEMEEAIGKLLRDSFELIEQEPDDGSELEAGCLSCS